MSVSLLELPLVPWLGTYPAKNTQEVKHKNPHIAIVDGKNLTPEAVSLVRNMTPADTTESPLNGKGTGFPLKLEVEGSAKVELDVEFDVEFPPLKGALSEQFSGL
jgi:hypothetical protein